MLMQDVKDAIILAGGMGTRMLPASLYMPKETMPLVDTPILNHLIWEASKAGVERIHLVLSERKKKILDTYLDSGRIFDSDIRTDLPREALELGHSQVEIIGHIQSEAGGVGDAIAVPLHIIEGPFLVLLGDNLLIKNHIGIKESGVEYASEASLDLVNKYRETGLSIVGVNSVPKEDLDKYGVVEFSEKNRVSKIVEKPDIEDSPSNYVLSGRYILPRNSKELIKSFPLSEYGELQSIALLNHLAENEGLDYVKFDNYRLYDSGNPISWLKSQIDHSLLREDIGGEIREWLNDRLNDSP